MMAVVPTQGSRKGREESDDETAENDRQAAGISALQPLKAKLGGSA